jgi:hypothetical protein
MAVYCNMEETSQELPVGELVLAFFRVMISPLAFDGNLQNPTSLVSPLRDVT